LARQELARRAVALDVFLAAALARLRERRLELRERGEVLLAVRRVRLAAGVHLGAQDGIALLRVGHPPHVRESARTRNGPRAPAAPSRRSALAPRRDSRFAPTARATEEASPAQRVAGVHQDERRGRDERGDDLSP